MKEVVDDFEEKEYEKKTTKLECDKVNLNIPSLPITALSTTQTSDSSLNITSTTIDGENISDINDIKGKGNKTELKNEVEFDGKSPSSCSISRQGSKEKGPATLGLSVFDTMYSMMKSNFS